MSKAKTIENKDDIHKKLKSTLTIDMDAAASTRLWSPRLNTDPDEKQPPSKSRFRKMKTETY